MIFWASVIFLVKFFGEIEQLFEKNLGKMTIGFRSILVISFEKKKIQFLLEVLTAILKDFFIFFSKWSPFSKMLFFNGDIKIS